MSTFNGFDQFDEEERQIKNIMMKYNNRKRQTMQPSPYSLFFLDKGKDIALSIYNETNKKPSPDETLKRLHFEWNRITEYEKNIYMRASYKLEYKPKATNTKDLIAKLHSKTHTNQVREFLKLFSFN